MQSHLVLILEQIWAFLKDTLVVVTMAILRAYYLKKIVSNDGKVLGSDEGIKLGSTYGQVLGSILEYVDGITLGFDVGTEMGSLDGYLCFYNDGKI